jgi:hypothetical protein
MTSGLGSALFEELRIFSITAFRYGLPGDQIDHAADRP